MDLGWKLLIPLALGWVLLIAALDIFDDRGFGSAPAQIIIAAICVVAILVFGGLLMIAILKGQEKREQEGEEVFG